MSILIKGMEMPKEYGRCMVIFPDGRVTTEFGSQVIATAVPIPPHGRLIDADALNDICRRRAWDEWNKSAGTNWSYAYATFEGDVEDAPTIIPAEEAAT